jgi:predicted transcriptional regulator
MNFIEEKNIDARYIEFAQKMLEKKENDFIINSKYEGRMTPKEIDEKSKKIKEIINKINNNISSKKEGNYLQEEDYNTLRELAVSKGGFLNMNFRRKLYKILLFFNEEELSLEKPKNENNKNYIPSLKYYKNIWIDKNSTNLYWKNELINQEMLYSKDRSVIRADTIRSDINSFFPSVEYPYVNSLLKERLEAGLNILINFNNTELKYFQGYHDIFILFFYLYLDSPYTYISLFQRFSELYIKENLLLQSKNNLGYSFPNSIKFCMAIIKELSELAYNDIVEYCNSECIFIIPYIVSLFTHNMNNLNKRYRIIDYLMVSNPITVYVMSSVIVVDEINKLKSEYNLRKLKNTAFSFFSSGPREEVPPLSLTDFYQRFQNLNLDLANFEEYIEKTEKAMKKMNLEKIRNEFLSEKYQYQKYYPIIYKEKYLRDLTQSDDQKQNKIINNNIGDKSDDCVFDLLLNGYEKLYGKKIYSEKDIKKRNNFTYLLFVVLSLFTMILAYFIFKKLN